MISRMTSDGKPIISPLSDPINSMVTPDPNPGVISGIETEGTDALDNVPHPGALFWSQFNALRYGQLCERLADRQIIKTREMQAKANRQARAKVEWQEEAFV